MITCKSLCDSEPFTLSSFAEMSVCTSAISGSRISLRSIWKVRGSRTRLNISYVSSSVDSFALEYRSQMVIILNFHIPHSEEKSQISFKQSFKVSFSFFYTELPIKDKQTTMNIRPYDSIGCIGISLCFSDIFSKEDNFSSFLEDFSYKSELFPLEVASHRKER